MAWCVVASSRRPCQWPGCGRHWWPVKSPPVGLIIYCSGWLLAVLLECKTGTERHPTCLPWSEHLNFGHSYAPGVASADLQRDNSCQSSSCEHTQIYRLCTEFRRLRHPGAAAPNGGLGRVSRTVLPPSTQSHAVPVRARCRTVRTLMSRRCRKGHPNGVALLLLMGNFRAERTAAGQACRFVTSLAAKQSRCQFRVRYDGEGLAGCITDWLHLGWAIVVCGSLQTGGDRIVPGQLFVAL